MNTLGNFNPFGYSHDGRKKFITNKPKRTAEFVRESKLSAIQKRQIKCERNLKLKGEMQ